MGSNHGYSINEYSCPSDCESGTSGAGNRQPAETGLVRIGEGESIYDAIVKKFVAGRCGIDGFGVEDIFRVDFSKIMMQAKIQSFCVYSRAVEIKCGGNANVKYAWFGGSRKEIDEIVLHGFGLPMHWKGVHLSPLECPIQSVQSSVSDENGIRHMLLCRVILGKYEVVCPNSGQYIPSSEDLDSGVDNSECPRRYIVWSSRMNTHILPEFVVSFRASSTSCKGFERYRLPNSHWMPFATLISELAKFLPRDAVESIAKFHCSYKKKKVTRHELIQMVRNLAGDKLLMAIIKSYRAKHLRRG